MTRYELARDKKITIAALVLEVFSVVSLVLLGDSILGDQLGVQTVMTSHLPWQGAVAAFLVIQYALVAVEMIARYREDAEGFTIPLIFLPFGNIARLLTMICFELLVAAIKLLVYFISVLIQFLILIVRLDKYIGTTHLVDGTDFILEPFEKFVNKLYNLLYFNKIQTNANVFNAIFNGCLTMWCINH